MLMAVGGPVVKNSIRDRPDQGRQVPRSVTPHRRAMGQDRRRPEAGQRPSAAHATTLATKARQAATTKSRAARLTGHLDDSPGGRSTRGARLSITGMQGPTRPGRGYMRLAPPSSTWTRRRRSHDDAWEAGGDKGFMSWATGYWGQEYVDDWLLLDDARRKPSRQLAMTAPITRDAWR